MIIQDDRPLWNHRLLIIVCCDLSLWIVLLVLLKIFLHQLFAVKILHKLHSHHISRDFLRQIILCRSETSCQNYDIRTVQCCLNGFPHTCLIVAHYCLIIDRQPKLCTFFGKICTVGIYNVSKKYFCSHRNQLCYHLIHLLFCCRLFLHGQNAAVLPDVSHK